MVLSERISLPEDTITFPVDSRNAIGSGTSCKISSAIEAMDVALSRVRAVIAHFKPYTVVNMN